MYSRNVKLPSLGLLLVVILTGRCCGDIIWFDPISGANPSSSNPFNSANAVVSPDLIVSGIGHGSGVTPRLAPNEYRGSGFHSRTLSQAISSQEYFSFRFAPAQGANFDLESLVFESSVGSPGPTNFALLSSLDGFSSILPGTITSTGGNIDLTSLPALTPLTFVEFRLYAWNAANAGNSAYFAIRNFTFRAVPEPSAFLTCLGGLLFVNIRRRRVDGP